jgi:hypothetical protein
LRLRRHDDGNGFPRGLRNHFPISSAASQDGALLTGTAFTAE